MNDWPLTDAADLERCIRATMRTVYGHAAMLCGNDRADAETLVRYVYDTLGQQAARGETPTVTTAGLRTAVLDAWTGRWRRRLQRAGTTSAAAMIDTPLGAARSIPDLPEAARAVVVLRHVYGLDAATTGHRLGLDAGIVHQLDTAALEALGVS